LAEPAYSRLPVDERHRRLLELGAEAPRQRAAVKGWLWLMDGVILDWLEHRDLERPEVRDLLLDALRAAA
jgi:hypothetical protein